MFPHVPFGVQHTETVAIGFRLRGFVGRGENGVLSWRQFAVFRERGRPALVAYEQRHQQHQHQQQGQQQGQPQPQQQLQQRAQPQPQAQTTN
ncbi:hypothetical protein J3F84DRAFT_371565 [Trichoderma pleuroticola]